MRRELNTELDRLILDSLSSKYGLTNKREGIHLSSLIGCLTRGYLDLFSPIQPTDQELILWATGYGLQDVLTPDVGNEGYIECEGIVYRPDALIPVKTADGKEKLVEMKSTRAGVKRYQEGNLPQTWIIYMMAGCHILNRRQYELAVLYLSERPMAKLICETVYFDQIEIDDNWRYILTRKREYEAAIKNEIIPTPFQYCYEYECNYCRYKMTCDALVMLDKHAHTKKDIEELW
ncbi:MAG: hypothetical protein M0R06_00340 [Sphaerochaeta sp.]|nr:hypothetical protein [Sphaerochaeta sp.]